jgi:hypothetical protein
VGVSGRNEWEEEVPPLSRPTDPTLQEDLADYLARILDQVKQINSEGVHAYKDPAVYLAKHMLERGPFDVKRKATSIDFTSNATFTVKRPRIVRLLALVPVPRGTTLRRARLDGPPGVEDVVEGVVRRALHEAGVTADLDVRVSSSSMDEKHEAQPELPEEQPQLPQPPLAIERADEDDIVDAEVLE